MRATSKPHCPLVVCILAGGLSQRMGRDKSRLRLGGRTLLGHIRVTARELGFPVRVIRHDAIPRSGPIGGIYTALQKCDAEKLLFLACDMPFISADFLRKLIKSLPRLDNAVFAVADRRAGFPCLLRRETCLPLVSKQIDKTEFSLQSLARVLKARLLRPRRGRAFELTNINTPSELNAARLQMQAVRRCSGVAAGPPKSRRAAKVY